MSVSISQQTDSYHVSLPAWWCVAVARGRIPTASLLLAPDPAWLADAWQQAAQLVLCTSAGDGACGTCAGCRRVAKGNHPDCIVIGDDDDTTIKIEEARELIRRVGLASFEAGAQVAVIREADRLTEQAANALLKTLEEPSPDTYFLLTTATPDRLPPTVRSRCQVVLVDAPGGNVGLPPMSQLTESYLIGERVLSDDIKRADLRQLITELQGWCRDVFVASAMGDEVSAIAWVNDGRTHNFRRGPEALRELRHILEVLGETRLQMEQRHANTRLVAQKVMRAGVLEVARATYQAQVVG